MHVKELDRRCEDLYRTVKPTDAIRSMPGIGPALAPLLVGIIANASQFRVPWPPMSLAASIRDLAAVYWRLMVTQGVHAVPC